jgi:pimeloyl-ACP methyl ester carboxylesterase
MDQGLHASSSPKLDPREEHFRVASPLPGLRLFLRYLPPTAQRAWRGDLPYEPQRVRAPVAIMRGEWDGLIPDQDARWLFDRLAHAAIKRDIKIARATHLMHLETMRYALYRECIAFLDAGDIAPAAAS